MLGFCVSIHARRRVIVQYLPGFVHVVGAHVMTRYGVPDAARKRARADASSGGEGLHVNQSERRDAVVGRAPEDVLDAREAPTESAVQQPDNRVTAHGVSALHADVVPDESQLVAVPHRRLAVDVRVDDRAAHTRGSQGFAEPPHVDEGVVGNLDDVRGLRTGDGGPLQHDHVERKRGAKGSQEGALDDVLVDRRFTGDSDLCLLLTWRRAGFAHGEQHHSVDTALAAVKAQGSVSSPRSPDGGPVFEVVRRRVDYY